MRDQVTMSINEDKNKTKIKLLLHAEDGTIPFLTPYLLKNYFSPDSECIQDHLVVGVAIKDTCIAPVFRKISTTADSNDDDNNNSSISISNHNGDGKEENGGEDNSEKLSKNQQKKKKRKLIAAAKAAAANKNDGGDLKRQKTGMDSNSNNNNNDEKEKEENAKNNIAATATPDDKNNIMKPIGYTFENINTQSLLAIPGYNTLTVPTFDLVDDVINFSIKKKSRAKDNKYGHKDDKNNKQTKNNNNHNNNNKPDLPLIATTSNQITVCSPHGMQKLTSDTFVKIIMKMQQSSSRSSNTNLVLGLYDQTHLNDKKKRKVNCIERTKSWMNKLIQNVNTDNNDNGGKKNILSPLICSAIEMEDGSDNKNLNDNSNSKNSAPPATTTITPNSNTKRATNSTNDVLKSILDNQEHISGIAMVGLHQIPSREARVKLLQHCYNSIQQKCKTSLDCAVLVTKDLKQILDATRYGVNIFGCDLPAKWARSNKALALSLKPDDEGDASGCVSGRSKVLNLDEDGCIDLSNSEYFEDALPLVPGCQCFSGKYTRSYIHHLIKANELLADIILFGHNLNQMLLLCKELSRARDDGTIDEYCQFIERQIGG